MDIYFILFGISASLLYGLSIVIKKKIFYITNIPSYVFTLVSTLSASILGLVLVIIFNINIFSNIYFIGILSVTGALYGISLILYFYALEKDEATRVSQLAGLEIVVVPISAIIILQESPTLELLIGAGLIILAISILTIGNDITDITRITKIAAIPISMCLILWATQDIIMKSVLSYVDFLFVYFWVRLSSFIMLSIFARMERTDTQSNIQIKYRNRKRYI
jgi:drug/metabolite transporter (DMT)-like permease